MFKAKFSSLIPLSRPDAKIANLLFSFDLAKVPIGQSDRATTSIR